LFSFFTKKKWGAQQCKILHPKTKKKKNTHTHTSLKPQTLISTSIWNAIFRVSYEKDWRKVSSLKAQKSSRDANLLSSGISSKKREIELVLSFEEEGLKKSI